jgi:hypothetical protein
MFEEVQRQENDIDDDDIQKKDIYVLTNILAIYFMQ